MRTPKIGKWFFISLTIPYIFVFFFTAAYLYRDVELLTEYSSVYEALEPLKDLSTLITKLNEWKVNYTLQTEGLKNYEKNFLEVENLTLNLAKDLKTKKKLLELCSCQDIFKIENELTEFLKNPPPDVETALQTTNRYVYKLNRYYLNLSSHLNLYKVSFLMKTFYFLHEQYTVISDYVAFNFLYLYNNEKKYLFSYPYLRGFFLANVEAYYALLDGASFLKKYQTEIWNTNLIKNLLKGFYSDYEVLLKDFNQFTKYYESYKLFLFDTTARNLNGKIFKLELGLIAILGASLITAVLFAILHYQLYQLSISSVNKTVRKLYYHSSHDPLTRLLSRRAFNYFLFRKLPVYHRQGEQWSLILFDLDDFKKINDTLGHKFGDKVLRYVADIVKKNIRVGDLAFRWGGEEFAIFVKGNLDAALKLAERLRQKIAGGSVDGIKISASFGVGEYKGQNPLSFFHRVDQALYKAKKGGKNRVEVAEE